MAGTDTSRGINFQYACGISFILDSLQEPHWQTLQFEGEKDIEDIVILDKKGEVILRAQIKQKEDPHQWTPSELRDVLLKFSKCEDSEKIIYLFIYAGSEGPVVTNEVNPILYKIEFEGSNSLTPLEKETLDRHFNSEVVGFVYKVAHRLKFIKWSSEHDLETRNLLRIRKLFSQNLFSAVESDYDEKIYYKLFHLVAHKTSPRNKYLRRINREQIQSFLRINSLSIEDNAHQDYRKQNVPLPPLAKPSYPLVGRVNLLHEMKQRLLMERMYCDVALSGLPGVGKTALAIELAHDPEVRFHFCDGILWASSGLHSDVLNILGEWAVIMGIPRSEVAVMTSIEERAKAVRTTIEARRMLLIVDDVWQIEAALALRVGGPSCAHLITTRLRVIAQQFTLADNILEVQELNETDGTILFNQLVPKVVHDEPDEIRNLVQAVGGLPLALILLGKYLLKHSNQSRRLYMALERLRSVEERLQLAQPQAPLERHPSLSLDVPLSLQAIIQISLDELDEISRHVLYAISVFPPKPNTFSEAAILAVTTASVDTLDNLYDYGLLENAGLNRYTLHQTISDYARLYCKDEDTYVRRLATFFSDLIQKHETEHKYQIEYEGLDLEITNILAAIQATSERDLADVLIRIVNTCYRFLETRGLYYLTQKYLEQCERMAHLKGDIFEQEFALYHLGRIANRLGQYIKAANHLYDALLLAYQREDIDQVIHILGDLSETYLELGDYQQAEKCAQESLSLSYKFGLDGINVAARTMLGTIYARRDDYERAEIYYREALNRARELDSYSELSPLLSNLAVVVSYRQNYAQAEAYFQEALTVAKQTKNYEHIAAAQLRIAYTALMYDKREEAEDYLLQVLKLAYIIKNRKLIHSIVGCALNVAHDCNSDSCAREYLQEGLALACTFEFDDLASHLLANLGAVASRFGEYSQARDNFQEALKLSHKTEQYDLVFNLLSNLGKNAIQFGNFSQAKQYFESSLTQASKNSNKQQMILALTMLGKFTKTYQNNYTEAKMYLERGLALAHQENDLNITLELAVSLYEVSNHQENYASAEKYLQEALELARKLDSKEKIFALLIDLYRVAEHCEDYMQAEVHLKEALVLICEQNDLEKCEALFVSLAKVASKQLDYLKAEEYLNEALALAIQQGNKERILALLLDLHQVTRYHGNHEKAETYLQRALTLALEMGNRKLACEALNLLSSLHFDQQSFNSAHIEALEALALAQEENDQYLIAVSLHNLGRAAEKQGDFMEARRLGQKSLDILEKMEDFPVDFIRQWLATLPGMT